MKMEYVVVGVHKSKSGREINLTKPLNSLLEALRMKHKLISFYPDYQLRIDSLWNGRRV